MARELKQRLSISDASSLYVEKPNTPMHVGSCRITTGMCRRTRWPASCASAST